MVVANPVPQRCATPPPLPDDESNHLKDECEDDSDGGSSSLEDDADFGGKFSFIWTKNNFF